MAARVSIGSRASEDRLEKLIEERLKPGADKERIDRRIWDLFGESWCVMFTDLSGFSRGVAKFGIIHFLQTIHESERLLIPLIEELHRVTPPGERPDSHEFAGRIYDALDAPGVEVTLAAPSKWHTQP